jgi:thiamine biosynthesis protein ThiS
VNIRAWVPGPAIWYFGLMRLTINGEEQECTAATLEELIEELGIKGDRVAAELNREIVPRSSWRATALKDGDRLEIVHFVGGGRAQDGVRGLPRPGFEAG